MRIDKDVSRERLVELYRYEPETGHFYWRERGRGRPVNRPAGSKEHHGYIQIRVDGVAYMGHRMAWLYRYGEHAPEELDHINSVKDDNRIANLRPASRSQNMTNRDWSKHNKHGFKGVYLDRKRGRFCVRILYDGGKRKYLGAFDTPEEAGEAYKAASAELHKEFSNCK